VWPEEIEIETARPTQQGNGTFLTCLPGKEMVDTRETVRGAAPQAMRNKKIAPRPGAPQRLHHLLMTAHRTTNSTPVQDKTAKH